jgi:hypothetical protein
MALAAVAPVWEFSAMPQRPSKKPKAQPPAKPGAAAIAAGSDQASQQRHREKTTKAILGKFQGRKSI